MHNDYVMVISVQSFAQLYSLLLQRKLLKICTVLALRFIFGFMQALVGSSDNLAVERYTIFILILHKIQFNARNCDSRNL